MDNLGKRARDKVTGFEEIITSRTNYLFGCVGYSITAPVKDGEGKIISHVFDEGRVEILGEGVTPESVQVEKPGGDPATPEMIR